MHVIRRKSDGLVTDARRGPPFKAKYVRPGYEALKIEDGIVDPLTPGTLSADGKTFTPLPVDTAAADAKKAIVDAMMAIDPDTASMADLKKVVKYIQQGGNR